MQTEMMTYLEHLQDKQIKEDIEYLPEEKKFLASYPYTDEIHNLLPNREIVLRRATSLEHNLKKKPEDIDLLNKSLFDSFDRGVFRFLSQEEIKTWRFNLWFYVSNFNPLSNKELYQMYQVHRTDVSCRQSSH